VIFAFYMNPEQRIKAFVELGHEIREIAQADNEKLNIRQQQLKELAANLYLSNAWFTPVNTMHALDGIATLLEEKSLRGWLEQYPLEDDQDKTVGVVMAGNLPAVGFHDFMCVLLSGCRITAKLSSDDRLLIPAIAAMLVAIEPEFADKIHFTDGKMLPFQAIIATGSNNSARYFEYYFGKYPHIIRKSRTSVAILDGNETNNELKGLADDVFMYFGMGCRSVTKLMVPLDYDPIPFLNATAHWDHLIHHSKYLNNYEYSRAAFLVNSIAHFDTGYLLMRQETALHSPIGVLNFERYQNHETLLQSMNEQLENLQCIVARKGIYEGSILPGNAQKPGPMDYADGVDTMKFLNSIQ
jgi:hypothetical protein